MHPDLIQGNEPENVRTSRYIIMYDSVKNKIKPKKKISFICRNDKLFLCHNDIAVIQYMCLQIVIYANYHSHKKKKYTITLKKNIWNCYYTFCSDDLSRSLYLDNVFDECSLVAFDLSQENLLAIIYEEGFVGEELLKKINYDLRE